MHYRNCGAYCRNYFFRRLDPLVTARRRGGRARVRHFGCGGFKSACRRQPFRIQVRLAYADCRPARSGLGTLLHIVYKPRAQKPPRRSAPARHLRFVRVLCRRRNPLRPTYRPYIRGKQAGVFRVLYTFKGTYMGGNTPRA